jgi:hypothetical protein
MYKKAQKMFIAGVCPVIKRNTSGLPGLESVFLEYKNFEGAPVYRFFNPRFECGKVHHAWLNADGDLCLLLHIREDEMRLENIAFAISYSMTKDNNDNIVELNNFACALILKEDALSEQKITWVKKK